LAPRNQELTVPVLPIDAAALGDETDAHPRLTVRRPQFDWRGVPVSWLPDDPVAAQVINVIHLALPAGERWFVDVYREALPQITDPRLRAEMKAFMGQEAVHARSHAGFVEHMDTQGYETAALTRYVEDRIRFWERLAHRFLSPRRALRARVAAIAGIEHFTAVLGEWALRTDVFDRGHPAVAYLLRWHGAEEVEHKCVAFDVHQAINRGSYVRRVLGFGIAAVEVLRFWNVATRHLLDRDPAVPSKGRRRAVRRAFRGGNLPGRELLRAVDYLHPRFHPSRRPTLALSRGYLSTPPGPGASAEATT
jgi:uncharacterized protein